MRYEILSDTDLNRLAFSVNQYTKIGWKPHGPIITEQKTDTGIYGGLPPVTNTVYSQALTCEVD